MPVRAFVSQNIEQLKKTLRAFEKALQNGSLEELRVAGILTRTSKQSQTELQDSYNQVRYELYLRARCLPATDANRAALVAEFTNPYTEKIMRVEKAHDQHGVLGVSPFIL